MSNRPTDRGSDRAAILFVLPATILFAVFVGWPSLHIFSDALYEFGLTNPVRHFVGLGNFDAALKDPIFWTAARNNLVMIVGSIVIQVGLGTGLAAILDRCIRRGSAFFRTVVFAPMVMSAVAVGLVWSMVYHPIFGLASAFLKMLGVPLSNLGLLGDPNTAIFSILLVHCWQYTGFVVIVVLAGMQSIPIELYQAAKIDGAKNFRAFLHITLPGIRNVLLIVTLITAIVALKSFDLVYVMTGGGPGNSTQVLGTLIYKNAFELDRGGYASALAVFLLLAAVVLGAAQLFATRASRRAP